MQISNSKQSHFKQIRIHSEEKICLENDDVFKEDWLKTYSNKKKAVKQYKKM